MTMLRRGGRRQAPPQNVAEPDMAAAAETVLDSVEVGLGERPRLVEGPEPIVVGAGPDAYSFQVDTDDPRWSGTLIARLSPAPALHQETAWIRALQSRGYPTPVVVASPPDGEVLVLRRPAGTNLAEAMVTNIMKIPTFLATFGRLHAELHALPTDGLAVEAPGSPLDELRARADAAAVGADVAEELDWLDSHRLSEVPLVMCNGDLNPTQVIVDEGDPPPAVPLNWTGARLAEPAYDVAATVTAFWSMPIYGENAVLRTTLKAFRDSLMTAYLERYRGASERPLDDGRLAYWQAFHLAALAVELTRVVQHGSTGTWDTVARAAQPPRALAEVRRRFQAMAQDAERLRSG